MNRGHVWFDIYLEFSGQREYLTSHRYNSRLYKVLKDGIYLDDFRRWKPIGRYKRHYGENDKAVRHLGNTISYIVKQADRYIGYRIS